MNMSCMCIFEFKINMAQKIIPLMIGHFRNYFKQLLKVLEGECSIFVEKYMNKINKNMTKMFCLFKNKA